jgi:predicted anti-sigma-YlaC factor YlaD
MKESNSSKASNINCEQASDFMMRYFDHDLNDFEKAIFKLHIKECEICRNGFKAMSQALSEVEQDVTGFCPEDGFENRVMIKINAFEEEKQKSNERTLAFIYTILTISVTFIGLLIFVISQEVNINNIWNNIVINIGPINNLASLVSTISRAGLAVAAAIFTSVTDMLRLLSTDYGYVIVALFIMFFALQQSYVLVAKRNIRNALEITSDSRVQIPKH